MNTARRGRDAQTEADQEAGFTPPHLNVTRRAVVSRTKGSVWPSMRHMTPWSPNNSRLCGGPKSPPHVVNSPCVTMCNKTGHTWHDASRVTTLQHTLKVTDSSFLVYFTRASTIVQLKKSQLTYVTVMWPSNDGICMATPPTASTRNNLLVLKWCVWESSTHGTSSVQKRVPSERRRNLFRTFLPGRAPEARSCLNQVEGSTVALWGKRLQKRSFGWRIELWFTFKRHQPPSDSSAEFLH